MSFETSINARIIGTAFNYLGLASAYTWGMYKSREFFDIGKGSSRVKLHDSLYSLACSTLTSPLFYYLSGSRDLYEIGAGTVMSMGVALATGAIVGYTADAYRDFADIKASRRLPVFLKKQSQDMKKGIMAMSVAASVAASCLVYDLSKNFSLKDYLHSRAEKEKRI
jgi:hypothetical protein